MLCLWLASAWGLARGVLGLARPVGAKGLALAGALLNGLLCLGPLLVALLCLA
jgi:hypothetical protein